MKILLMGNKGQVGREVEELAAAKKFKTVGFDADNLDISNPTHVRKAVAQHIDSHVVINAAAYTAVDKAEDEPDKAYLVNRDGVKNLAEVCRDYNIPLLHISTDYVFSGEKYGAYHEGDFTLPLGVYGNSKLAGEEALMRTWHKHVILRISWVFGRHGNNFVKTILRLAHERDSLDIVGDQFGCPTGAKDVARVLLEMAGKAHHNKWGVYNYCGASVTNWCDFAQKIIDIGKTKFPLQIQEINRISSLEYPTKAMRPQNSELMVSKITTDYDIKRHTWERYLHEVIDEMKL